MHAIIMIIITTCTVSVVVITSASHAEGLGFDPYIEVRLTITCGFCTGPLAISLTHSSATSDKVMTFITRVRCRGFPININLNVDHPIFRIH